MQQQISESTLNKILTSEGGYNPDEDEDVGGSSYAGITQKAYDAFLKTAHCPHGAPLYVKELGGTSSDDLQWKYSNPLDIPEEYGVLKNLIKAFYEKYYLPQFHVDELPECLQYIHADFAINAGSKATKIIQEIIGTDADGIWGSGTSAAVVAYFSDFQAELALNPDLDNRLISKYDELKRQHYHYLAEKNPAKYADHLLGWLKRCNHVLSELQEYFEDEKPTPKAFDADDPALIAADKPDAEQITNAVLDRVKDALPNIIESVLSEL